MPKGYREKRLELVLKLNIVCDYGCETQGHYRFENGKICCCESSSQCLVMKRATSEANKKHYRKNPDRAKNHSEKMKGCRAWNKGLTKENHSGIARRSEKLIGLSTWNKGLNKNTDKRVAAYAIKGRKDRDIVYCDQCGEELERLPKRINEMNFCNQDCHYEWKIGKQTRENNPVWVPKLVIKCDQCGKEIERLPKKTSKTNFCCVNCQDKYHSERMSGKGNSQYVDGASSEPYGQEFNEKLKEGIRDRDRRKCVCCGKVEIDNGRRLDVHHIDRDKMNNDESNLVSLCKGCHTKANSNKEREWWKIFYQNMMRSKQPLIESFYVN